jgi:rhodanese-related sulfurtransferase
VRTVTAGALRALATAGGAAVVDVGPTSAYRRGHLPYAWSALRSRLPEGLDRVTGSGRLVLTSPDGVHARLAAADLVERGAAGRRAPLVLDGGTAAWVAAGYDLSEGDDRFLHGEDDVARSPWAAEDRHGAFRAYLAREVALRHQLARDATVPFRSLAEVTA